MELHEQVQVVHIQPLGTYFAVISPWINEDKFRKEKNFNGSLFS